MFDRVLILNRPLHSTIYRCSNNGFYKISKNTATTSVTISFFRLAWFSMGASNIKNWCFKDITLREKCPNMEFFLVRIVPHSVWIRRDTNYLSVFSPKRENKDQKKLRIWTHFTQCNMWETIKFKVWRTNEWFLSTKDELSLI